ncbi:MAG: glycosyltransferase [Gammaproteobacteria bacterium]
MFELRLLHLSLTPFVRESRLEKEIVSTKKAFPDAEICVCALHEPDLPETEERSWGVVRRLRLRTRRLPRSLIMQIPKYLEWRLRVLAFARRFQPSVVQIHSVVLLPIGHLVKRLTGARLVYDAHALESERDGLSGVRRALSRLVERIFIRRADAMLVASESVGQWYRERFPRVEPMVVRNVPLCETQSEDCTAFDLKRKLGIGDGELLFLYLGLLGPGRGIDRLLDTFANARSGRQLALMGSGPWEERVRDFAECHGNVHWIPPAKPDEIIAVARTADVGVTRIENSCLDHYYSVGDDVFECLMARLPVIVPGFPETRRVVEALDGGWIVDEGEGVLARLIDGLEPREVDAKKRGLAAVGERLSWSREFRPLLWHYARWHDVNWAERPSTIS